MNKSELIELIANQNNSSKVEAENAINIFINGIIGAVSEGNDVSILGFGTFSVNVVDARQGINPMTKEPLQIEAYNQVRFKVGQKLKDAANNSSTKSVKKTKTSQKRN
jgi:DNA-binding protein HU-beta